MNPFGVHSLCTLLKCAEFVIIIPKYFENSQYYCSLPLFHFVRLDKNDFPSCLIDELFAK